MPHARKPEVRTLDVQVEYRAATDESPAKIVGYAAVFDKISAVIFDFREVIRPGAFAEALKTSDVRALWNHNSDYVLGRTKSGTLTVEEDEHGLRIEIEPPNTQWAKDALETIRRGDVDQMSFAFYVSRDGDNWKKDEMGFPLREIIKVSQVDDVSPVTYPAYPDTEVSVRSLIKGRELTAEERAALASVLEEPKSTIHHRERRLRLMEMTTRRQSALHQPTT